MKSQQAEGLKLERVQEFPSLIAAAKWAERMGMDKAIPKQVKVLHPKTGELVVRWVLL